MGLMCTNYFENYKYDSPKIQIITCKGCLSHLCLSDLIILDKFSGSSGPAYLVDLLINFEFESQFQETEMLTGIYVVSKIRCHQCKSILGWYYKKAYSYRETYKEGKFVIEKEFIKFIDNNLLTNALIENALKNKFRRRYSLTLTVSSEDIDLVHSNNYTVKDSKFNLALTANYDRFNFSGGDPTLKTKLQYRGRMGVYGNRLVLPAENKEDESSSSSAGNDEDLFVDA